MSGSAAPAGANGTGTGPEYSGPLTNTSPPSITQLAKEAQTLTEVNGTWTPSPDSRSYQWEDCNTSGSDCSAIAGADKQTYQLTIDDVGSTIRVTESATVAGVTSDPVASTQTAVVTPLPISKHGATDDLGQPHRGPVPHRGTWHLDQRPHVVLVPVEDSQRRWEQLLVDPGRHRPEVPAYFD